MDDFIRRQDAIDGLETCDFYIDNTVAILEGETMLFEQSVISMLMELPSAEPTDIYRAGYKDGKKRGKKEQKRRKGKWVNNLHDIPICNQCGYMTPYDRAIDDYEYGNFCPNCGADMRGTDA